ncbi:MAG: oligosaccharide flippase family protein, partial [Candidatus Micrarchaeota archaeon]|nr:oligosaccharide flippase family protein [Candidatus Micrarchaeota archaeon]
LFVFSDAIANAYGQPIGPVMPYVAVLALLFMLFNFWASLLDSLKQFGTSAALQAIQQVFRVGLTLAAFLWIGRTADIALGTYTLTLLLPTLWLVWHFWEWLGQLPGKLAFSWGVLYESMRFGIPAYISSMADVISTYIDVLMVGSFLGLEAVAAYSAMVIFVRNIAPFVLSILSVVQQPLLVEFHARGSKLYDDLVREGSRWTMYFGVPLLGLFLLYSPAILGIATPKYVQSAGLIWFFAPMVLFVLLSNSSRAALFAHGRSGLLLLVSVTAIVLSVAFNWMLIPRFGLAGSAIASSLAIACGEALALVLARQLAGAKLHPDILKSLLAGSLMVGVGFVPLIPAGFASGGAAPGGSGAVSLSQWAASGAAGLAAGSGTGLAAAAGAGGWDIVFACAGLGMAMGISAAVYGACMIAIGAFTLEDRRMGLKVAGRYLPQRLRRRLEALVGEP